jgi:hypothetical protein
MKKMALALTLLLMAVPAFAQYGSGVDTTVDGDLTITGDLTVDGAISAATGTYDGGAVTNPFLAPKGCVLAGLSFTDDTDAGVCLDDGTSSYGLIGVGLQTSDPVDYEYAGIFVSEGDPNFFNIIAFDDSGNNGASIFGQAIGVSVAATQISFNVSDFTGAEQGTSVLDLVANDVGPYTAQLQVYDSTNTGTLFLDAAAANFSYDWTDTTDSIRIVSDFSGDKEEAFIVDAAISTSDFSIVIDKDGNHVALIAETDAGATARVKADILATQMFYDDGSIASQVNLNATTVTLDIDDTSAASDIIMTSTSIVAEAVTADGDLPTAGASLVLDENMAQLKAIGYQGEDASIDLVDPDAGASVFVSATGSQYAKVTLDGGEPELVIEVTDGTETGTVTIEGDGVVIEAGGSAQTGGQLTLSASLARLRAIGYVSDDTWIAAYSGDNGGGYIHYEQSGAGIVRWQDTKAFVDETPLDLILFAFADERHVTGTLTYSATVANGTNVQAVFGIAAFACINQGDTEACTLTMQAAEAQAADGGSLVCTPAFDVDETNAVMLIVECNSEADDSGGTFIWKVETHQDGATVTGTLQ